MSIRVSAWSRRYLTVSALYLLAWQIASLQGVDAVLGLGVMGFVLHAVFGEAYTLLPGYFDTEPASTHAMGLQLFLTAPAGLLVALEPFVGTGVTGSVLWFLGVVVFLGNVGWSVRGNLTGRRTGTAESKSDRRWVDRVANAFVPVALAYLALGSYQLLAVHTGAPSPLDALTPRVTHLLAAGVAALMVFAVGFRLLPRFLVEKPRKPFVAVVLPAGALAPLLIAAALNDGAAFQVGAVLEAIAVIGFAAAYIRMYLSSDRNRVGFHGVLLGSVSGVLGVLLGLSFAFGGLDSGLVYLHSRLNVMGFLGLTIVGVVYQFYPPNVGKFRGAGDTTALASIALLALGLAVETTGVLVGESLLWWLGRGVGFLGALVYAYMLVGLLYLHRRGN